MLQEDKICTPCRRRPRPGRPGRGPGPAIGKTVEKMIQVQRYTSSEHQAEKVLFIIITDGEENSSCKYSREEIRRTIRSQNRKYGWEFIFLGANIDAVEAAKHFGIAENRAQNYHADAGGVRTNFEVISETVENYRCSSKISKDCTCFLKIVFSSYRPRKFSCWQRGV